MTSGRGTNLSVLTPFSDPASKILATDVMSRAESAGVVCLHADLTHDDWLDGRLEWYG